MEWKQIDLMRGADKLVRECAGVQSDEDVLVVCDTSTVDIGLAIASAAIAVAKEVTTCVMRLYARMSHGEDPPRPIAAAMKESDVVFAPTAWSLYHAPARREACEAGARVISMGTVDEEMLVAVADTPFLEMQPIIKKVTEFLQEASTAHMTTPGGSDVTFDLRGRSKYTDSAYGLCRRGDKIKCQAPPCLEVNISPVEDTTEGIFVVDASQAAIGLVRDPITLRIEKGTIVKIEGREEARRLREYLENLKDSNVYRVAELGIGMNPRARMRGHFVEDEAVYGTAHIGIGNNASSWGGKINAVAHSDNITWWPTVKLDGKTIMKDGKLTIKDVPEIRGIYSK